LYALLQSHEKPTRSEAKRLITKFEDELIFSIEQQLSGWSGPHIADAGSFWHCRDRGISVWENPASRLTEAVEMVRDLLCRAWLEHPLSPDQAKVVKSPGNSRASSPRSFDTVISSPIA
jgi:hypothetical protein